MQTHFWQAVQSGEITSSDIQAELDDINKAPRYTIIEERQILDLQEALSYAQARERASESKGEQRS